MGKKEKHCDADNPDDDDLGDRWDHVAVDPECRLLLTVIPGERTAENSKQLIQEVHDRTRGRTDLLLTSDAYAPYTPAVEEVYGVLEPPPQRRGRGRPRQAKRVLPPKFCYATVSKKREQGRVVEIMRLVVFGTMSLLALWLKRSKVSTTINTSFVERNNGTDRRRNARKHRKTYSFSKDLQVHEAATYFISYSYNFCWTVRTLRVKDVEGHWHQRTPAMVAKLADHVWSLQEWLSYPAKPC